MWTPDHSHQLPHKPPVCPPPVTLIPKMTTIQSLLALNFIQWKHVVCFLTLASSPRGGICFICSGGL